MCQCLCILVKPKMVFLNSIISSFGCVCFWTTAWPLQRNHEPKHRQVRRRACGAEGTQDQRLSVLTVDCISLHSEYRWPPSSTLPWTTPKTLDRLPDNFWQVHLQTILYASWYQLSFCKKQQTKTTISRTADFCV